MKIKIKKTIKGGRITRRRNRKERKGEIEIYVREMGQGLLAVKVYIGAMTRA